MWALIHIVWVSLIVYELFSSRYYSDYEPEDSWN